MSIKKKVTEDMKEAMKSGNFLKKTTLRMILSEFQYAQTAHSKDYVLTEAESYKVIQAYHKKLKKSLKDYPEGETKSKITQEISIVEAYLPKAPSKAEVERVVEELLSTIESPAFGLVMKKALEALGQYADAKLISETIKEKFKK